MSEVKGTHTQVHVWGAQVCTHVQEGLCMPTLLCAKGSNQDNHDHDRVKPITETSRMEDLLWK